MAAKLQKFIAALAIVIILSVVGLSFFTWPVADDFIYIKLIREKGIIGTLIQLFLTVDGRNLTPIGFLQSLFFWLLNHNLNVFIWDLLFIVNVYLLISFVYSDFFRKAENFIGDVIIFGLVVIFFFYGLERIFFEVVFWRTGGIYMLHLFLALLWLKMYFARVENFWFYFLSFIVALGTQNLIIPIISLLIIDYIKNFIEQRKFFQKKLIALLIIFLVGLLYISLAPGSITRASSSPHSLIFNPIVLIKHYYTILRISFDFYASIFLLSAPVVAFIFRLFNVKIDTQNLKPEYYIKFIIMGLASLTPFVFIPYIYSARAGLFFYLFIYIALVILSYKIILLDLQNIDIISPKLIFIFILFVFVVHLFSVYEYYKIASSVKKQVYERVEYLNQNMGKDTVYVKPLIYEKDPFCFKIENFDIKNDPNYWLNQQLQIYFNIKAILLEPDKR